MRLSPRLRYITSQVPHEEHVIDVGADHSYVAIYLAQKNPDRNIIASDIASGPLTIGRKNAQKYNLPNLAFRQGNGLSVLSADDQVQTAVIAGLGGLLIREILKTAPYPLLRYILQPQNEAAIVRAWLEKNNYEIIADERIIEQNHIYETIVAKKRTTKGNLQKNDTFSDVEKVANFYFGPAIHRKYQRSYHKWLALKVEQLNHQIRQMKQSMHSQVLASIKTRVELAQYGARRLKKLQESEELAYVISKNDECV